MNQESTAATQLLIASDHAGFELKEWLKSNYPHVQWTDLGPSNSDRVDYPDFADRVASRVAADFNQRAVLICGSGQGMAIRANRYPQVRAGLAWNEDSVRLAREHNNVNVLCMGARFLTNETALKILELFLHTPFEGGRHQDRVSKLSRNLGEC